MTAIYGVVLKYFVLHGRSNSPTNVAVKSQIKHELQLEKENYFSPEQIDSMLVSRVNVICFSALFYY